MEQAGIRAARPTAIASSMNGHRLYHWLIGALTTIVVGLAGLWTITIKSEVSDLKNRINDIELIEYRLNQIDTTLKNINSKLDNARPLVIQQAPAARP